MGSKALAYLREMSWINVEAIVVESLRRRTERKG
jgi:hypothetical protein